MQVSNKNEELFKNLKILIDRTNREIDIYDKVKMFENDNYLSNYIEYSDFFRKVLLK